MTNKPSPPLDASPDEPLVCAIADVLSGGRRSAAAGRAAAALWRRWPDLDRLRGVPAPVLARQASLSSAQLRRLQATFDLLAHQQRPPPATGQRVATPDAAASLLRGLAVGKVERFWAVALGPAAEVLGVREVAVGGPHTCPVAPRAVFSFLLDAGAHRGLVAHNHPGGDPSPSEADLALTARLAAAGEVLAVPLIDHLIVASGGWVSLAAEGLLPGEAAS